MDSLDDDEWDRTVVVIDRLVALGSSARMPLSRSLGDGLFELRFTLGPTARRITYRFTKDGRIVLLTTFRKQRNNERTEIARARKAAEDCAEPTREGDDDGQLLPLGRRQEEAPRPRLPRRAPRSSTTSRSASSSTTCAPRPGSASASSPSGWAPPSR